MRVAVGLDAAARLLTEAARYARMPAYARSFAAMSTDPGAIGVAARDAAEVVPALAPYRDVLDETVVRALPASSDAGAVLDLARAARP